MTTFVPLASPTLADIPSRLAIFLGVCIAVYLLGAVFAPETRGRIEDPTETVPCPRSPVPALAEDRN